MVSIPAPAADSTAFEPSPSFSSVLEAADALRNDLLQIERALRVVSREAADLAPILAAQINVAAHLARNAAAALPSDDPVYGR